MERQLDKQTYYRIPKEDAVANLASGVSENIMTNIARGEEYSHLRARVCCTR